MKRKSVLVAIGLWLAWRGGASALHLGREAARMRGADVRAAFVLDEDERIARGLAHWERQAGLEPGHELELYRSLRRLVPPDSRLFVSADREAASKLAYTHLAVLLYPTRLFPLVQIPGNWREGLADWGRGNYLLEHRRFTTEPLDEAFELLHGADDFRLWTLRPVPDKEPPR